MKKKLWVGDQMDLTGGLNFSRALSKCVSSRPCYGNAGENFRPDKISPSLLERCEFGISILGPVEQSGTPHAIFTGSGWVSEKCKIVAWFKCHLTCALVKELGSYAKL